MNRRENRKNLPAEREQHIEKVSVDEVARFLRRLSTLYRDSVTGNPPLSDALTELADGLSKRRRTSLREGAAEFASLRERPIPLEISKLKDLSPGEVEKVISDDARPKTELVELGIARFGISRSRLKKMNKTAVIETIRSALQHEESLRIISQEAGRGGRTRSS